MNSKFDKIAPGIPNKMHFLVDAGLAVVSLFFALHPALAFRDGRFSIMAPAAVGGWIVVAALTRLYSPHTPRSIYDYLMLRLVGVAGVTTLLVAVEHILYERLVFWPVAFALLFFGTGAMTRMAVFKPLSRLVPRYDDVLIVGSGPLAVATQETLSRVASDPQRRVVGFLRFASETARVDDLGAKVLGDTSDLLGILRRHPVSEVFLAGHVLEHGAQMQSVVQQCERLGLPFALPVHSLRLERARLMSSSPARDGYLHYMSTAAKPVQYTLKRLVDISASALALVALSPLLLGVALAIKLTSKGPVLFVQPRVGLHGSRFWLLKFRSMVVNAEALKAKLQSLNEQKGPVFKIRNDPRITAVGRFIRKYSIDELPQLVNILRGDMSIVGPRPALPSEVEQYEVWQRRRLSVRPGLTCYWQVGGRNDIAFEEWMRLDLRYVDHWNLGVDIQLIAKTFTVVLAGRGAS